LLGQRREVPLDVDFRVIQQPIDGERDDGLRRRVQEHPAAARHP